MEDKSAAVIFPVSLLDASALKKKYLSSPADRELAARWQSDWSLEREAQVEAFEVAIPGKQRIVLKLGSMQPPMDVMRNCLDDLLASWGLDVAVQKSLEHPPIPAADPSHWIDWADYPKAMLAGRVSDHVDFRLNVDATGKPTGCSTLTMDARQEFMTATCDSLMKRARFNPALDASGKPVASIWVNSVQFVAG
jgi:hypothetical protein